MKNELTKLVEVDTALGEITPETAKMAAKEESAYGALSIIAFSCGTVSGSLGLAFLLGGCGAAGAGCAAGGVLLLLVAVKLWRASRHYELIQLAYLQRDSLRRLRGDDLEEELLPPRKKK